MFVLGVDPGLSRCGYGLVARGEGDGKLRAHAAGVLETDPSAPLAERLLVLHTELFSLLDELRPQAVVVERVFFQVNARTAMSVGQASGLALVAAAAAGCEVAQYTANEVKQGLVGYGAATKDQVQRMVAQVLGLPRRRRAARRGRRAGAGRVPPDDGALPASRRRGVGDGRRSEMRSRR